MKKKPADQIEANIGRTEAPIKYRAPPRHADPRIPNYRNAAEPATASRLRRRTERWEGLGNASRLALIKVFEHGGYDNPIIHRGSKHLRSKMGSRKTNRQQVIEGRGHRDLAMLNECDPDILDYQAHPFEMTMQGNGSAMTYRPDHIRVPRYGPVELIEVKRTPADLADPDYREKLGVVAEIARRVGWTFRVMYHSQIVGPPDRMRNVESIYMQRFTALLRNEEKAIAAFVAAGTTAVWSELRDRVCPGDSRRGEAVLRCAIARARIAVDLDAPITDTTLVAPRPPVPRRRRSAIRL